MHTYTKFVLLVGVLLASSLTMGLAPFTSTAFAATNSHTTSNLVATKPMSFIRLAQSVHVHVSTVLTSSRNSAGNPCSTRQSDETFTDGFGNVQFWLRMQTYYCWNHVIVTYHSTTLYWGVTTLGIAVGWLSLSTPYYAFNCYVSTSSSRNCSGNHEHAKEAFINGPFMLETDLIVDQEENYQGLFLSQGSQRNCIGGC